MDDDEFGAGGEEGFGEAMDAEERIRMSMKRKADDDPDAAPSAASAAASDVPTAAEAPKPPAKLLVAGDVRGRFGALFAAVAKAHSGKAGPFEAVLCVGESRRFSAQRSSCDR